MLHQMRTFELSGKNGEPLAQLRKRFIFFRRRVDMHPAEGTKVEMHGNILDFECEFRIGEQVPARDVTAMVGPGAGAAGAQLPCPLLRH